MEIGRLKDLADHLRSLRLTETIQTALIERFNLTATRGNTTQPPHIWSKARSVQALYLHAQWWRLYYQFSREHESLRVHVPGLRRRYGRAPRLWSPDSPTTDGWWATSPSPVMVMEGTVV
jgi:transposase InsO family protein